MVRLRRGTVVRVVRRRPGALELEVGVGGDRAIAIAYPELTGPVGPGDDVVLNTTAVDLGLGTGGVHFVVAVTSDHAPAPDAKLRGRVMKARYTPSQTLVQSVEETHAAELERSPGLDGTPVVVAPLHSMVAPIAAGAKAMGAERVVYVMTDGAALPGPFSQLVAQLREVGLLDAFVTAGQAFGGELEAVTVWTGLLAARELLAADVVVVSDGPGNLGTETTWGVSALLSGQSLNAAGVLGGRPVAAIRVSFVDERERHRGLSHHSRTILSKVCLVPATVAVPQLDGAERETVWAALRALEPTAALELVEADGTPALEALRAQHVDVRSMGRSLDDDRAFFLAAGAAGVVAGRLAAAQAQRDR